MKLRKSIVIAGTALALALIACGSGGKNGEVETAKDDGRAVAEAPATTQAAPKLARMNGKDTTTIDKTLKITVGAPAAFKPGQYSIVTVPNGGKAFGFTVVVTNVGDQPVSLLMTSHMSALAGKEGAVGEPIFDSAQKYNGMPEAPLQPGKKVTFKYGFTVPTKDTSEIQVTFEAFALGESATFTGSLDK